MANINFDGIFTMGDAIANGYKVAFVNGNRNINAKNVASKVASIQKYGGNLVPLMVVEGTKAIAEGNQLTDAMTGEAIENGENVLVVIDGQHRTEAALKLGIDLNNIRCFLSFSNASTVELLASTNTDSKPWDGSDYAHCAVTLRPDNEVAQFAAKLDKRGIKVSTAGLILYRKGGCLTKANLDKIIRGEELKVKATAKFDLAEYFLEKASGFPDSFIAKRYLIEAVIDASDEQGFKPVCDKVGSWTEAQRKRILDAKASEQESILREMLAAQCEVKKQRQSQIAQASHFSNGVGFSF